MKKNSLVSLVVLLISIIAVFAGCTHVKQDVKMRLDKDGKFIGSEFTQNSNGVTPFGGMTAGEYAHAVKASAEASYMLNLMKANDTISTKGGNAFDPRLGWLINERNRDQIVTIKFNDIVIRKYNVAKKNNIQASLPHFGSFCVEWEYYRKYNRKQNPECRGEMVEISSATVVDYYGQKGGWISKNPIK